VDQPAFIPAGLVVNHEESRDIREDIDEGTCVVRIRRQPWLRFEHQAHCPNCRQAAIRTRGGWCYQVVNALEDGREDIRFKIGGIEKVVRKELARTISFGKDR
jgi:hypothetical protein